LSVSDFVSSVIAATVMVSAADCPSSPQEKSLFKSHSKSPVHISASNYAPADRSEGMGNQPFSSWSSRPDNVILDKVLCLRRPFMHKCGSRIPWAGLMILV
jgi:hypothetical protein